MACFTLTSAQRLALSAAIINGMENVSDEDYGAFWGPLIDELEAAETPIEITVVPIEKSMTHAEYVDQINTTQSRRSASSGFLPK